MHWQETKFFSDYHFIQDLVEYINLFTDMDIAKWDNVFVYIYYHVIWVFPFNLKKKNSLK